MADFSENAQALKARMADLLERAEVIEDDLRHPLEADSSEQAIDLADDEALAGVDEVLEAVGLEPEIDRPAAAHADVAGQDIEHGVTVFTLYPVRNHNKHDKFRG